MRQSLSLLFFLILLSSLSAQVPPYITVVDGVDLIPVEQAEVEIQHEGETIALKTDARGRIPTRPEWNKKTWIAVNHPDYFGQEMPLEELAVLGWKLFMEGKTHTFSEVVLSARKKEENRDNIPHKIEVIKAKEIAFQNPQTSADLLIQNGGVFVQKSQMGGGSPNIRGFEANKVLIVVDGIRLNNAIYRGGHLQNVITLDPNMIERTEVLFGPASVIYGSDALGGVMHFYSRTPALSSDNKVNFKLNAFTRYASANSERTGHLDFNLGWKKFGMLTSVTASDFGSLRSGKVHHPDYPDFGKREFFAARVEDRDSMVPNDNVHLQRFSGYSQLDFMQKFYYLPNENSSHTLNIQASTSSNVPRYDRLSEYSGANLKYADWYYGPQDRFMALYVGKFFRDSSWFDQASLRLAFQDIGESRNTRLFGNDWLNSRTEGVQVYTANLDFNKQIRLHDLTFGLEYNLNRVQSAAQSINISDGSTQALDTRYPDGGSMMQYAAAFFSHEWKLSEKLRLTEGVRFTYVGLESNFDNKSFFPFLDDQIRQNSSALSGSLGLVWKAGKGFRVAPLLSTGFRAPNVDDLGKVFDSSPGNVIVPNPNVRPEYTYNAEMSLTKDFGKKVRLEATGFLTWFDDALVIRDFSLNGQDSIVYDGILSKVQATTNAGEAILTGLTIGAKVDFNRHFSARHTMTWTYGQDLSSDVPLDHIPPLFGRTSVSFQAKKFRADLYSLFNGWKRIDRYSPSGEDNEKFATPDGIYSWATLNLKTSWAIHENIRLQLGLENILDTHYRHFASGISAPGRNLIASLRANF